MKMSNRSDLSVTESDMIEIVLMEAFEDLHRSQPDDMVITMFISTIIKINLSSLFTTKTVQYVSNAIFNESGDQDAILSYMTGIVIKLKLLGVDVDYVGKVIKDSISGIGSNNHVPEDLRGMLLPDANVKVDYIVLCVCLLIVYMPGVITKNHSKILFTKLQEGS